ncbi:unnamed protein product [Candidula unifasciata]|uniref:Prenylcysteine lyase domain-containing protein n=1 Tax=Candidula unifasciata TaxID=100452 RepID=A0A8S3Z4A4_9EUPU|nr:unnamed protein product [Candidula unifasciata]
MWSWSLWSLLLALLFLHKVYSTQDDDTLPRIAVIGAGLGGASSAYFLRQLFGKEVQIDVFEANRVGGRAAVINIDGQDYEAGASIIHKKNRYMAEFASQFNKSDDRLSHSASFIGLYGNSGMVFQTSDWQAVSLAKLLWRYGFDLYTLREWTKHSLISKFERIYEFQDRGMAFTTLEDMLRAMSDSILNMTRHSLQDVLRDAGLSQRFIDELAMAALRNNYGQTTSAHGFVGAVSLIGAESDLWSVRGGNKQIVELLLKESKASLIEAKVTSVILMKDELGTGSIAYEVEYEKTHADPNNNISSREYDIVVVATPVSGTKHRISFIDFPNPMTPFVQDYHTTIAMFVQGRINSTTFKLSHQDEFPTDLFTVSPDLFFNSIGKLSSVNPGSRSEATGQKESAVWKTFLNKVPTEEQINQLFENRSDLRLVDWLAYPEYRPGNDLPPFMLYDRLYYVNAIESAAAAMEISVIGAKNVALLAFNQWHGHFDKIDELHLEIGEEVHAEL